MGPRGGTLAAVLLAGVALAAAACGSPPETSPPVVATGPAGGGGGRLRTIDWDGVRYPLDCGAGAREGAAAPTTVVQVAYADPAPDVEVAVVLVRCAAGAGSPPRTVYVYRPGDTPATPRLLQTLSDDGAATRAFDRLTGSLAVAGASLTAEGRSYSSAGVPRCCPDGTFTARWTWTGGAYQPAP